ncbi:MAG: GntR family transcriptional regulator, partial [Gammaproteobacteria bacterium]|nr:GntR family transcriptional regulator [Gammaproteobacteria bacterium]
MSYIRYNIFTRSATIGAPVSSIPDFQPLYKQVYNVLVQRIATGAWRPAQVLPSEQALASELGVSQGTVRKAMDALA